jgi:hypothetical protein
MRYALKVTGASMRLTSDVAAKSIIAPPGMMTDLDYSQIVRLILQDISTVADSRALPLGAYPWPQHDHINTPSTSSQPINTTDVSTNPKKES